MASEANERFLLRNHELPGTTGVWTPPKITCDPKSCGGTSSSTLSPQTGQWLTSWANIGAPAKNRAGGPTPWNSRTTCEETSAGTHNGRDKSHGRVFDVPAVGLAKPIPLMDMVAFSNEAVAADPVTGYIYVAEDSRPSGVYRLVPNVKKRPDKGVVLQGLKRATPTNNSTNIGGVPCAYFDTGVTHPAGTTRDVERVDINEPHKMLITGTTCGGVRSQGLLQGASGFGRGEGMRYGNDVIYIRSTSGGAAGEGRIFACDPRKEKLTLIFEPSGNGMCDKVDNMAWSPRGGVILGEDGGNSVARLHGSAVDGTIFPACGNNDYFSAAGFGRDTHPSDRRLNSKGHEFCGATFCSDWLFGTIQSPGITFAITGSRDNGTHAVAAPVLTLGANNGSETVGDGQRLLDARSPLQAVQAGTLPGYGRAMTPFVAGSNGIDFHARAFGDPALRPTLTAEFSPVPEPEAHAFVPSGPALVGWAIRRRCTPC